LKHMIRNLSMSAALGCASTAWAQPAVPATSAPATRADQSAGQPSKPKATAQSEAGEPRASISDPGADAAERAPSAGRSAAPAPTPKSGNPRSDAADKLQLGTATVTGDREQPKVMYVVPWKKPDIGDAEGRPMNSLVDEILSPVDRDVFKREVRYYQTIKSEAPQNGAPPAADQVEK